MVFSIHDCRRDMAARGISQPMSLNSVSQAQPYVYLGSAKTKQDAAQLFEKFRTEVAQYHQTTNSTSLYVLGDRLKELNVSPLDLKSVCENILEKAINTGLKGVHTLKSKRFLMLVLNISASAFAVFVLLSLAKKGLGRFGAQLVTIYFLLGATTQEQLMHLAVIFFAIYFFVLYFVEIALGFLGLVSYSMLSNHIMSVYREEAFIPFEFGNAAIHAECFQLISMSDFNKNDDIEKLLTDNKLEDVVDPVSCDSISREDLYSVRTVILEKQVFSMKSLVDCLVRMEKNFLPDRQEPNILGFEKLMDILKNPTHNEPLSQEDHDKTISIICAFFCINDKKALLDCLKIRSLQQRKEKFISLIPPELASIYVD